MRPAPSAAAPGIWAVRGLFALALVFALREARALLAPVVIALMLAFVLGPLVQRMRRHGIPEVLGAALVVMALLASTVPMASSLATPAADWLAKAPTTVAQLLAQLDRLRAALPLAGEPPASPPPAPPLRPGSRASPAPAATPAADPLKERLASEGVALTGLLLGRGVSLLASAAATLILLYFLLASEHWIVARWVEALPRRRSRALLLGGARAAQREIGHFLLTQGLINATVGLITGVALWWLGLPNPTLWGVLVAVLNFAPYAGPLMLMALLLVAGIVSFSEPAQMLGPMLAYAAIHAVEGNIASPWIVGRRLALSPIAVFLSVLFWGWLWGIAGALIAVPMLIALRNVCLRVRGLRLLARFLEGNHRAAPTLRVLLRPGRSVPLRRPPPA